MRLLAIVAVCSALLIAGCHSAYIQTSITNHTAQPIELLEVDYPSASFGTQHLAPGASFHYRFKVLGSGPTKLLYTDASHKEHTAPGPGLKEGDEGQLAIDVITGAPRWSFTPKR